MANTQTKDRGLTVVFVGDGKGKTTAALGCILRAAGHAWRACFIQFMKNHPGYGEVIALRSRLGDLVDVFQFGAPPGPDGEFTFVDKRSPSPVDLEQARLGLEKASECIASGTYQLVVLDEILAAVDFGLLGAGEVTELVRDKPAQVSLIVTGHQRIAEIEQLADVVTVMSLEKYEYRAGQPPRPGLEY